MDDFIVIHEGAGQFLTGFAEGILLDLPQVVEYAAPLRVDQEETITPVAAADYLIPSLGAAAVMPTLPVPVETSTPSNKKRLSL
jgi:hypothetical protein